MIKKLARGAIEMISISLTILLIVSVFSYIEAGGNELVIARTIIVIMVGIVISCILSLIGGKRAWLFVPPMV